MECPYCKSTNIRYLSDYNTHKTNHTCVQCTRNFTTNKTIMRKREFPSFRLLACPFMDSKKEVIRLCREDSQVIALIEKLKHKYSNTPYAIDDYDVGL